VWPDDASLCLWDLPPGRLTSTLLDLVEHGTGSAAYYADVMEAIVALAVQVSAQSWPGLAADEDERYRIAATAEGGIWLLRTPHPDPVVGLAGNRSTVDSTRRLTGGPAWSEEGSSRAQLIPVVDPDLVRGLGVGQVAYVHQGGVSYIQVKRVVAAPAALPRVAAPPAPAVPAAPDPAAEPEAEPVALAPEARVAAEVAAFLDEAFGRARA
jgi:hypothetical protein